jgi:hypothetical protein
VLSFLFFRYPKVTAAGSEHCRLIDSEWLYFLLTFPTVAGKSRPELIRFLFKIGFQLAVKVTGNDKLPIFQESPKMLGKKQLLSNSACCRQKF